MSVIDSVMISNSKVWPGLGGAASKGVAHQPMMAVESSFEATRGDEAYSSTSLRWSAHSLRSRFAARE